MKNLHTIKMISIEDGTEIVYKDVKSTDTVRGGCLTVLYFEDGSTATFDKAEWELWDLTPQRGWNYSV